MGSPLETMRRAQAASNQRSGAAAVVRALAFGQFVEEAVEALAALVNLVARGLEPLMGFKPYQ